MINRALFKQGFLESIKYHIIFISISLMYILAVVWMYDPELSSALDQFVEMMPELMALMGVTAMTGELIEFVSQYLYGMLLVTLPLIFIVLFSKRLVVDMVEKGSMAYLLTAGHNRGLVVRTQALVLVTFTALMFLLVGIFTIATCEFLHPGILDMAAFWRLNFGAFCLELAIAGFCFMASCLFNDSSRTTLVAAGVPVFFYLVKMMANMGGSLADLQYATFFSLFDQPGLITGSTEAWLLSAILLLAGVLFFIAAGIIFRRRDFSL